jgi:serine/threonine-protein kinase HipA
MTSGLVLWLDGALTGRLTRHDDGRVEFDYSPTAGEASLSVSMPRSLRHHPAEVVMPWLDNLLPDNDDVRIGHTSVRPIA